MKITTIQVPNSSNDFDEVVNETEERLRGEGTPVKFTQTHVTPLPDGDVLFTAVLFYQ
jgi:hypothetical protein